MLSTESTQLPSVKLGVPKFTPGTFKAVCHKIEPYREGGIRVQGEEIGNKRIYHNYGHGASEVALGFGSSNMCVRDLYKRVQGGRPLDCAVLGCGLIGLFTAIELSKMGNAVTIYTDRIPKYNSKQFGSFLSSQIDDGLWLPSGYDKADKTATDLYEYISFEHYKQCFDEKLSNAFKVTEVYEKETSIKQLREKIPQYLYNHYRQVNVDLGNGSYEPYIKYKMLKIDTKLLIEELKVEALVRGVKIVEKKFNELNEILSLNENILFNCLGNSSGRFFPDSKLESRIRQYVVFENPTKLEYSLSCMLDENTRMRITASGNQVLLKCENRNNLTEEELKNLIRESATYFSNRTIKPKL